MLTDLEKEVEKLKNSQSIQGNRDNSWSFLIERNQDILNKAIKQYQINEKDLFQELLNKLQKTTTGKKEKQVAINEIIMLLQSPLKSVFQNLENNKVQESLNQSPTIARMLGFAVSEFLQGMKENGNFRFTDEMKQKLLDEICSFVDELSNNRNSRDKISNILQILLQRFQRF